MSLPFDNIILTAVATELHAAAPGSVVEKVHQPTPNDIVLRLFRDGSVRYLLLSCDPALARAHFTVIRRDDMQPLPPFGLLLRKYLDGAQVKDVSLPLGFRERVLHVLFQTLDGRVLTLVAETQGRHSNLVLLGPEGVTLGAVKQIGSRVNRIRQTLPGVLYSPPPAQLRPDGTPRLDPFTPFASDNNTPLSAAAAKTFLLDTWAGVSPLLAREAIARAQTNDILTPTILHKFLLSVIGPVRDGHVSPCLWTTERGETIGAYPVPLLTVPVAQQHTRETLSLALDNAAASLARMTSLSDTRASLLTALTRAITRRERERAELDYALLNAARADEFQQTGDLLLASPHALTAEHETVLLPDWYAAPNTDGTPAVRTVLVNPALSVRENAETFYARARKARAAQETLARRRDATVLELLRLSDARAAAEAAPHEDALVSLRRSVSELLAREAAPTSGSSTKDKHDVSPFGGHRIRAFPSPDGWDIWVGEDAAANDFLTGRLARPYDIWMHARQSASAHAVLRVPHRGAPPPLSTLLRAAELVAARSANKHSSLIPVDYTLKKHVRKPRGSAPGAALYDHEKTLHVSGIHG